MVTENSLELQVHRQVELFGISQGKGGSDKDTASGGVWIFSRITQYELVHSQSLTVCQ